MVRLALGWQTRDVEQRSSAQVAFPDDDRSAEILEYDPAALAYGDPAHAFTLPPGRFLRVDQAAGRVYSATSTPHLDALTPAAAATLADSVARLLDGAGWARVSGAGIGTAAAVRDAAQFATSGADGVSVTHVGTWRVPRPRSSWAALPPGTRRWPDEWDGAEAVVTVRAVKQVAAPRQVRLILQVALSDRLLGGELHERVAARRRRYRGEMQTLTSWGQQPNEPVQAPR